MLTVQHSPQGTPSFAEEEERRAGPSGRIPPAEDCLKPPSSPQETGADSRSNPLTIHPITDTWRPFFLGKSNFPELVDFVSAEALRAKYPWVGSSRRIGRS